MSARSGDSQRLGFDVYEGAVQPDWIDVNEHMNVAYYLLAFDLGVDALWTRFGITDESIGETGGSTFAVECHVTYQAELGLGDAFVVTSEILAFDAKRIHQFQRMYRSRDGAIAATCEWMNLHVDLGERRVAPWPVPVLERIGAIANAQPQGAFPYEAGKRMRVPKPMYMSSADYEALE